MKLRPILVICQRQYSTASVLAPLDCFPETTQNGWQISLRCLTVEGIVHRMAKAAHKTPLRWLMGEEACPGMEGVESLGWPHPARPRDVYAWTRPHLTACDAKIKAALQEHLTLPAIRRALRADVPEVSPEWIATQARRLVVPNPLKLSP